MTNCEKTDNICDIKGLKSLMYKELFNNKGMTDNSREKLAKHINRKFTNNYIKVVLKHMKRCST